MHHPKNPVLGFHGWDETFPQGSVYLVRSFFFLTLVLFLGLFFGSTILEPNFFSRNSYLLLQPTYPSNLPTSPYLPHHPFALLYPKLQNHIELDRKLVEVVESLWSLGHETSSRALTLKVSDMV